MRTGIELNIPDQTINFNGAMGIDFVTGNIPTDSDPPSTWPRDSYYISRGYILTFIDIQFTGTVECTKSGTFTVGVPLNTATSPCELAIATNTLTTGQSVSINETRNSTAWNGEITPSTYTQGSHFPILGFGVSNSGNFKFKNFKVSIVWEATKSTIINCI